MTKSQAAKPQADILIVDDTPNNLRLLGQILGKQYKVRLAPSGQIALTAARTTPPDLILLDIMMPEMNGYEVADQLKAGQQTKEIPIIFISALDDTNSKIRAFSAGGVDYVTKPFQEKEVLARVETHLQLRNLYKQAQDEIAERKRAEANVRRMVERWSIVYRAGEEIGASLDTEQVFAAVHTAVEHFMPCEDFVISLYDEIRNEMSGSYILENNKRVAPYPYKADHGLGGYIVHSGQSLILNSPEQIKKSGIKFEPYGNGPTTSSVLAVPMQIKGKTIGILSAQSYHSEAYTREDQELLEMLAGHVAVAIDHARLFEQSQREIAERKQAEESLKESEEKYHKIFNNEIDAICIFDLETKKILDVNSAYLKLYGYTRDEVLQLTIDDISAEQEKTNTAIQKARVDGDAVIPERKHRKKDGTVFQVELSAGAYIWKGRNVMFAVARDITERKQAEDALRASNAKLEILFQVSPLAISLLDSKGIVQLWNAAAEQIFGWTSQEVIGHPNPIVPVDKLNEYTAWSAQILHGKSITNQETIRQRKDGSFVNVSISSAPVYDAAGNAIGRMAILADITERKRAEENEHEQRILAESLRDIASVLNSTLDLEQVLDNILANASRVLPHDMACIMLINEKNEAYVVRERGYAEHGVQEEILSVRLSLAETPYLQEIVRTAKPVIVPDTTSAPGWVKKAGLTLARSWAGIPIMQKEKVTGFINFDSETPGFFTPDYISRLQAFADQAAIAITNAQFAAQLEERVAQRTSELEAANRELENLSYNIAHDMRSPVRAMVGYANIMEQTHRAQLDSEGLQMLANIHASGLRLGEMIDGFLEFLHLGHVVAHIQPVNMDRMVNQLVKDLEQQQEKRQIEFSIGNLPECQADPKLLEQVWAQLISNALKFTRPREVARIEIGSGEADGKLYYFVRDNGVGFDLKYAGKLFGVFQKLHHESEFEGIGIGLAIAGRIVQCHRGKMWVEAEVDKGAAFYFTLTD